MKNAFINVTFGLHSTDITNSNYQRRSYDEITKISSLCCLAKGDFQCLAGVRCMYLYFNTHFLWTEVDTFYKQGSGQSSFDKCDHVKPVTHANSHSLPMNVILHLIVITLSEQKFFSE